MGHYYFLNSNGPSCMDECNLLPPSPSQPPSILEVTLRSHAPLTQELSVSPTTIPERSSGLNLLSTSRPVEPFVRHQSSNLITAITPHRVFRIRNHKTTVSSCLNDICNLAGVCVHVCWCCMQYVPIYI